MNYEETLDYLYDRTPAFHKVGSLAYKPGLERSIALDENAGNPHKRFKSIHVAGTNGKGSVAHLLAAILQASGYRSGFTLLRICLILENGYVLTDARLRNNLLLTL